MPSKIDKLTKEQEAAMTSYAQTWIDIGLKTGDADWETFEKNIRICYEKSKSPFPSRIVRVPSPFFGAHVASVAHEIWNKRYKNNSDSIRASVGTSIRDSVYGSVDTSIRASVHDSYEKAIVKSVIAVAEEYKVQRSWNYWMGGQFWVGYYWYGVAFCNFFFDICGLKLSQDLMERASAYRKVCESVNYMWLNRDFILVCDRPKHILRDLDGRLHSTEGKAIEYKDGWGLYMIHGVKFTEEQFNKTKNASISDILAWEDIDQRSVLLREHPIEKLLESVEKNLIDKTDECGGYELWEIDLKDVGKVKILSYKSWSGEKPYVKFVPSDSTNALETVAALRHQTVEELKASLKS